MRLIRYYAIALTCITLWYSCVNHDILNGNSEEGDYDIKLRWIKGHPKETRSDMVTGLAWNLSYLGATLPPGSLQAAMHWHTESEFSLDIDALGFSAEAENALHHLIGELRHGDEYQKKGAIDLGRFIVLTLNSAYHYYAITGASVRLSAYKNKFLFADKQGAIINSSIAAGHRLVSIAMSDEVSKISFIAAEGNGSISDNNFEEVEYETMDIMPNGQLRFALYDKEGNLKTASSDLSQAGKPAKCLWCHEINIQSLNEMGSVPGYYSYDEFKNIIQRTKVLLDDYRNTLSSEIDFNKKQDHVFGELLYISFMEPSAYRLAQEWGMAESDVKGMLREYPVHKHHEFSFFDNALYHRKDIDDLSPYRVIRVPENAREPSVYEPEIIKP